jgi:hypothetical protein
MTSSDIKYLAAFVGLLALTAVLAATSHRLAFGVFGAIVALFLVHMLANLWYAAATTRQEVLSLLRTAIDPERSATVLNGDVSDDYNEWDGFCAAPILNDRRLNRIRLQCYTLTYAPENTYFRRDSRTFERSLTTDGIAAVCALIDDLEDRPDAG